MSSDSGERQDSPPREANQKGGLLGRAWVGIRPSPLQDNAKMWICVCIFVPYKMRVGYVAGGEEGGVPVSLFT